MKRRDITEEEAEVRAACEKRTADELKRLRELDEDQREAAAKRQGGNR